MGAAALYALAMLLLGFAHMPVAAQGARPDLSAFALPDGSVPDICFGSQDGTSVPQGSAPLCAACLLTGGAGLPPHVDGLAFPVFFASRPLVRATAPDRTDAPQKAHPARGPPARLT